MSIVFSTISLFILASKLWRRKTSRSSPSSSPSLSVETRAGDRQRVMLISMFLVAIISQLVFNTRYFNFMWMLDYNTNTSSRAQFILSCISYTLFYTSVCLSSLSCTERYKYVLPGIDITGPRSRLLLLLSGCTIAMNITAAVCKSINSSNSTIIIAVDGVCLFYWILLEASLNLVMIRHVLQQSFFFFGKTSFGGGGGVSSKSPVVVDFIAPTNTTTSSSGRRLWKNLTDEDRANVEYLLLLICDASMYLLFILSSALVTDFTDELNFLAYTMGSFHFICTLRLYHCMDVIRKRHKIWLKQHEIILQESVVSHLHHHHRPHPISSSKADLYSNISNNINNDAEVSSFIPSVIIPTISFDAQQQNNSQTSSNQYISSTGARGGGGNREAIQSTVPSVILSLK